MLSVCRSVLVEIRFDKILGLSDTSMQLSISNHRQLRQDCEFYCAIVRYAQWLTKSISSKLRKWSETTLTFSFLATIYTCISSCLYLTMHCSAYKRYNLISNVSTVAALYQPLTQFSHSDRSALSNDVSRRSTGQVQSLIVPPTWDKEFPRHPNKLAVYIS